MKTISIGIHRFKYDFTLSGTRSHIELENDLIVFKIANDNSSLNWRIVTALSKTANGFLNDIDRYQNEEVIIY